MYVHELGTWTPYNTSLSAILYSMEVIAGSRICCEAHSSSEETI